MRHILSSKEFFEPFFYVSAGILLGLSLTMFFTKPVCREKAEIASQQPPITDPFTLTCDPGATVDTKYLLGDGYGIECHCPNK